MPQPPEIEPGAIERLEANLLLQREKDLAAWHMIRVILSRYDEDENMGLDWALERIDAIATQRIGNHALK